MFQYWADIKYRARRKSVAGGALGDLSQHEERLRELLGAGGAAGGAAHAHGQRRAAARPGDDERECKGEDASLGSGESAGEEEAGAGAGAGSTEELLAEAAMRAALAQEKTAEAAGQAVQLLRELVGLLRAAPPTPAAAPAPAPPLHHADHLLHHAPHHHRL